ncbi:MAG: Coenzyme F420 hydrogenase/dehydrogenase, beta subunit C-terminal domain [Gomphosphaeria aponina SAG 52.96 = DSM 107014]|uniref:Coenzyme F420 hydrogenase/dehydrogenase, beta subunit C-terminal domain n=1 Tax=Gomphosphaeria aponina SAG 52.96 = DSM 107014 TaxID=1521640 RepID=A0A941JVJ5_9CHRO|nr:Coenzyme F420 hydrogenase/dehydrogenase, beta subunit C-terminal domain [Gomphosphaeria aponina SAG 52.96 = DSM 107014]
MKEIKIANIKDVAERQLCTGCGACAYISPEAIEMVNDYDFGKRPLLKNDNLAADQSAATLAVCPGIELKHTADAFDDPELISALAPAWGPVYEVWEGYAVDEMIRFSGSSGGAATALALYCIEKGGMYGVLHTQSKENAALENETVISRNKEELLKGSGSRYAPASPCDGLQLLEAAPAPCVFVGKPCDVAAVQKVRKIRPLLDEKIGVAIAFFCAGTPSTKGTMELLKKLGIEDSTKVESLRYRGKGWPGLWTVEYKDDHGNKLTRQVTYEESWGFLQKYRQWRCYICPDHTGEFADIAVGDPWYREIEQGEQGSSLIVARTPLGKKMIHEAAAAGYIVLEKSDPQMLPLSQPNLLKARGDLWGRLWGLKLMKAPYPKYQGFATYKFWLSELSLKEKIQSIYGTVKRVFTKKLRQQMRVNNSNNSSN